MQQVLAQGDTFRVASLHPYRLRFSTGKFGALASIYFRDLSLCPCPLVCPVIILVSLQSSPHPVSLQLCFKWDGPEGQTCPFRLHRTVPEV